MKIKPTCCEIRQTGSQSNNKSILVEKKPRVKIKKIDKIDKIDKVEKVEKIKNKVINPIASAAHLKNYIDSLSHYRTVQIPLKNIVRDQKTIDTINSYVIMISRVMNHTSIFFKMFILYSFDNYFAFPVINRKLIVDIARIICKQTKIPNNKILDEKSLEYFFHHVYSDTMDPDDRNTLNFNLLTQCINYEADTLIAALETHVSEHYYDMVNRYCNIECYVDERLEMFDKIKNTIKRNTRKKEFRAEVRCLKNDILKGTDTCDPTYVSLKNDIIENIFGGKEKLLVTKDAAQKNPLSTLEILIKMSTRCEFIMSERLAHIPKKRRPQFKIINVFPLKTSIIPGYIPIDSVIVATLLFGKEIGRPDLKVTVKENLNGIEEQVEKIIKKDDLTRNGNLLKHNYEIWNTCFKMDHKIFKFKKNKYTFNRRIITDGFGCSILFIRNDKFVADAKANIKPVKKPFGYTNDKYIDELPRNALDEMKKDLAEGTIKLAANDPGHNDIAYFTDGVTEIVTKANGMKCKKTNKQRFTQNQRRRETKSKVFHKRIDADKKKTIIDEKTVKQIESILSQHNASTCDIDNFYDYVVAKNSVTSILQEYYNKDMYRYLRWSGKINRRRSDDNIVKRFKDKFGPPDKVILLYGDQDQHGMKFKESVKGKSMRGLFRRHCYDVYLVDEFRTSMKLYDYPGPDGEGADLENFCKMDNPKPKRRKKKYNPNVIEKPSGWKPTVENHELLRSKIYTKVQLVHQTDEKNDSETIIRNLAKNSTIKEWSERIRYTRTVINRNLNASLNILYKGRCAIEGEELPKRFKRKTEFRA